MEGSKVPYRRVDNRPLHDSLVVQVTRRIASGALRPGEALPTEAVLAEQFGVSRTVVREAIRVMATKGLLAVRQGSGVRVTPQDYWHHLDPLLLFEQVRSGPGEDLLDEVLEMRRVLEVEAAGLAASRRTDQELSSLRGAIDTMEETVSDPEAFTRSDIEFHDLILGSSRNRLLREALRPVVDVLGVGRLLTNRKAILSEGGAYESQRGHGEIYLAIEMQDEGASCSAMLGHLRQFERDIRASLRSPELDQIDLRWGE